jgi:hypothetical protein
MTTESDVAESKTGYFRLAGQAVVAAGVLTFLINAGLTPLLQHEAPYAETASSWVFLWRQALSALTVLLLLFGASGLYLFRAGRFGFFGAAAFALTFVGTALVFAMEWSQVFVVHGLALEAPDLLQALASAEGSNLFDLGSMIAFLVFTLGWIAFGVSMLTTRAYARRGPALMIAGFFAMAILTAVHQIWGQVIGNAVLALGWILLGRELFLGDGPRQS